MEQKKRLVQVRFTQTEYDQLSTLAEREEGNVSAFIRKQALGRRVEAILYLAQIHSNMLEIARSLKREERPLQISEALSYLVATERNVNDLLERFQNAGRLL